MAALSVVNFHRKQRSIQFREIFISFYSRRDRIILLSTVKKVNNVIAMAR